MHSFDIVWPIYNMNLRNIFGCFSGFLRRTANSPGELVGLNRIWWKIKFSKNKCDSILHVPSYELRIFGESSLFSILSIKAEISDKKGSSSAKLMRVSSSSPGLRM